MAAADPRDEPRQSLGSVPVPDPTKLTTDAVDKATDQWRRELSAARELLEAHIAQNVTRIEAMKAREEAASRERHEQIQALREVIETRLSGMDTATKLLADEVIAQAERLVTAREQIITAGSDQLQATRELLETRFRGMDEATKLLASNVDKVPFAILQEAGNLKGLLQREIQNVQDVAAEKFSAIEGTFASNALALTAALAAQKEAAAEQNKSNTLAITKSEQATKETIAANATQTATGQSSLSREMADLKERLVRMESGGVAIKEARTETRSDQSFSQTDRIAQAAQARAAISSVIAAIAVIVSIAAALVIAFKKLGEPGEVPAWQSPRP